jgi:methyl-accepting chemotaxis protein
MRQDLSRTFDRIGRAAAVMVAAVGAATAAVVRSQARQIDELGKTADAIGITTESMQALQVMGELAGVSSRQLVTNLERMQRRLGQVARNGGPAARALEDIGVNIQDIINLPADRQLEEIARAFAGVENATIRASIANDLFGRDGQRMLKLLNDLSNDGLTPLRRELEQLGFALDRQGVARVEAMNDSLNKTGLFARGLGQTLTVEIAGPVQLISERMQAAAKETGGFQDEIRVLVEGGVRAVARLTQTIRQMFLALKTAKLGIEGIGAVAEDQTERATGFFRGLSQRFLGFDLAGGQTKQSGDRLVRQVEDIVADITKTIDAFEDASDLGERIVEMFDEARRNLDQRVRDDVDSPGGIGGVDLDSDPEELSRKARRAFESTRTAVERARTELDEFRETIKQLSEDDLQALGFDFNEVIDRMEERIKELEKPFSEMSEFGKRAAQNIQDSFADFLFNPFEDGLKGMLRSFTNTLRRMAAEAASQQILGSLFGALAGSANPLLAGVGALFGGARADGGPVSAGKAFLVGERGPELMVPGQSGTIIPNHQMGGIEQTINIPLAFPPELEAFVRNVAGPAGRDAAAQLMRAQGGRL